jgi:hypothetical protein
MLEPMTDDKPTVSGNRWEPADVANTDQSSESWVATPDPAPVRRAWLSRSRTAIAGVAAAVLLAGGLGGFAIARNSAGSEGPDGADQRQGVPTDLGPGGGHGDGDGDRHGFERRPAPDGPGLDQEPPGPQAPQGAAGTGTDESDT